MAKNIKIQLWTDGYYAKTIAIWRPEEEADYVAPENDTRSDQEINVPYYLVVSSVFEGRSEVVGNNPVAPSQHPMPADFLKQQVRHISYMFANEFGIFKPATKAVAKAWIAKQTVGYNMDKEMEVQVSPAQGSMTLKDFRDSLGAYTDTELEKIQVMTIGENPLDAAAKGISDYIYTPKDTDTQQYISVTKLVSVYEVDNPYIDKGTITPETIENSTIPGTEDATITQEIIATQEAAVAEDATAQETLATFDAMVAETSAVIEADPTLATDVVVEPTKEEVLQQQIEDLKAQLAAATSTPGAV
jgi:hypothetical protein